MTDRRFSRQELLTEAQSLTESADYVEEQHESFEPGWSERTAQEVIEHNRRHAAICRQAAADAPESLPALTSRERHKGTGDVLKDLAHAQRMTDTSEPGFGEVICRGKELDFVNRAIRVAAGEIKQLRQRLDKKQADAPLREVLEQFAVMLAEAIGGNSALADASAEAGFGQAVLQYEARAELAKELVGKLAALRATAAGE
jgi:hypothetical protein